MFRVANVVMVVALLVTAAVVYQLKYASTAEAERLASLRAQIRKERDAISLLRAEWARRTSPIYIQGLAERHLDMKRLDVDSISSLDDLPEKPANNDDGIGGILEALSDAPLVTSSTGKVSGSATAPISSGGATVPATSALRPAHPPAPKPASTAAATPASRTQTRPAMPPQPLPAAPVAPPTQPQPEAPSNPLERFFSGFH
ncbi:hypothetical protein V5F59_21890 [Xanthobacter autotrophicus DSM 431]|uniref:cell division protein FtsL n=1 Tax=Xanthobacter nonsaccharivorans TaxID=3119912 RepID=UPI0037299AA0